MVQIDKIKAYFQEKFEQFGTTPQGEDWNSVESQEVRFEQLIKVIDNSRHYSIIDYGCGYGALYEYLKNQGHNFEYQGFDIVQNVITAAKETHQDCNECVFFSNEKDLVAADYVVESGIFNIKFETGNQEWIEHVIDILNKMDSLALKGFAFNCLTKYSDEEFMRPDLYYADPSFMFDYCKKNFSRNVALLHDYELYDFTILVRK